MAMQLARISQESCCPHGKKRARAPASAFLFLEIRRLLGRRWSCDESERQTGSLATSSLLQCVICDARGKETLQNGNM